WFTHAPEHAFPLFNHMVHLKQQEPHGIPQRTCTLSHSSESFTVVSCGLPVTWKGRGGGRRTSGCGTGRNAAEVELICQ
ncbi:hypothetical protein GOODEAATRI_034393, partial [Goodea atripinnis]